MFSVKKSFSILTLIFALTAFAQIEDPMGLWEIRLIDPAVALQNTAPEAVHKNVAKVEAEIDDKFTIKFKGIELANTDVKNHLYGTQATYTQSLTGFGINAEGIYINGIGAQIKFQALKPRAHKRIVSKIPPINEEVIQDMAGDDDNKDVGITMRAKGQTVLPFSKSIDVELYSDEKGNHLRLAKSKEVLAAVSEEIKTLFGPEKQAKTFGHELRNADRQKGVSGYMKALHPELNGLAKTRLDELLATEDQIFSTLFARFERAMPAVTAHKKDKPLAMVLKFENKMITLKATDSSSALPESLIKPIAEAPTPSNTAVVLIDARTHKYLVASELARVQSLGKYEANGFELNSDASVLSYSAKKNDEAKSLAEFFGGLSNKVDKSSSYVVALSTKEGLAVQPWLQTGEKGKSFLSVKVPFSLHEKDLSAAAVPVLADCQLSISEDGKIAVESPKNMPVVLQKHITSLVLSSVVKADTLDSMTKKGKAPISRFRLFGNAGAQSATSQWAKIVAIDVAP